MWLRQIGDIIGILLDDSNVFPDFNVGAQMGTNVQGDTGAYFWSQVGLKVKIFYLQLICKKHFNEISE